MKLFRSLLIVTTLGAAMTSCFVPGYPDGPVSRSLGPAFGMYDTLPDTFDGDAYYYQNRYYYGGNYERGVFHDHGREYNDRYYHAGRYYYGGRQEHHSSRGQQTRKNDNNGNHRDHDDR